MLRNVQRAEHIREEGILIPTYVECGGPFPLRNVTFCVTYEFAKVMKSHELQIKIVIT